MENSDQTIDLQILHQRGETLANNGEISAAESVYLQILALSPDDLEAVISLGNIGFHLGNQIQAAKYYLKAVFLNPESNELAMSASCILMNLGFNHEAGQVTDTFFSGEIELLKQKILEVEKIVIR